MGTVENVLNFLRFLVEAPAGQVMLVLAIIITGMVGAVEWKRAQALRDAVKCMGEGNKVFSDPESPFMMVITGLIATNAKQAESMDRLSDTTTALTAQATTADSAMQGQIRALEAVVDTLRRLDQNAQLILEAVERTDVATAGIAPLQGALRTLEENQAVLQATVEKLVVICEKPDQAVITCLEGLDRKMCEVLEEIKRAREVISG